MGTSALSGRRVLVAEDEYTIAAFLAEYLADQGVEVVGPAGSVEGLLALMERGTVDAALLDINLGGELVYPVADRLAEAGVPFVLTSGYDDNIPSRFARHPRCAKPYLLEVLTRMLEGALAAPAASLPAGADSHPA